MLNPRTLFSSEGPRGGPIGGAIRVADRVADRSAEGMADRGAESPGTKEPRADKVQYWVLFNTISNMFGTI